LIEMLRFHRNGRTGLVAFAVTPHYDIEIMKHFQGGYDVYAVRTSTRDRILVGHTTFQRDAKTAAAEWAAQARADYDEADRARREAIDLACEWLERGMTHASAQVAVATRTEWDRQCLKGHREFALAGAENEAYEEDYQRRAYRDSVDVTATMTDPDAKRQVTEWFTRHVVELKTDPTRQAYATIAYREADHAEALADDEARDAERLAAWRKASPARDVVDGVLYVRHPAPPVVPASQVWVPGLPVLVDAPAAPGACLHAGCHPGRCVYGPDHGTATVQ
jgi:hypothetical protein